MRFLIVVCLLFSVGCVLWSQPAYTDSKGEEQPAQTGIFEQIATGLGYASPLVPFAGLASLIFGTVAATGAAVTHKRRNGDAEEYVRLLDKVKSNVGQLASDKDVEKLIKKHLPKEGRTGKIVKAAYERLKKLGSVA